MRCGEEQEQSQSAVVRERKKKKKHKTGRILNPDPFTSNFSGLAAARKFQQNKKSLLPVKAIETPTRDPSRELQISQPRIQSRDLLIKSIETNSVYQITADGSSPNRSGFPHSINDFTGASRDLDVIE